MRVLVLDSRKQPLMPCRPARARALLAGGKAAVFRRYPFTIILKGRQGGDTQPLVLSVDPGSKTTGIALVALFQRGRVAIAGLHIGHRGQQVRDALESRRTLRRGRRSRHKHTCAYCGGISGDAVLEKEHIIPRALGGTNRLANHVISCRSCNEDKGSLHPNAWQALCKQRGGKLNLARAANMQRILAGYRPSLKDAAAVNATRFAVGTVIKQLLPTEFWSGGRTKMNRSAQRHPKDHWVDAACVGEFGGAVALEVSTVLMAVAKGHGSRQMCRVDKYGFPRTSAKQSSRVYGFRTGDMVTANVPSGVKKGIHRGRVAVRSSGSFNIQSTSSVVQGISHKHCKIMHRCDGYSYSTMEAAIQPTTDSLNSVAVSLP